MRDRKQELLQLVLQKQARLNDVQLELPKELQKEPPELPFLSEDLFMEANLKVVVNVPNPEAPDPNANKGPEIHYVKV